MASLPRSDPKALILNLHEIEERAGPSVATLRERDPRELLQTDVQVSQIWLSILAQIDLTRDGIGKRLGASAMKAMVYASEQADISMERVMEISLSKISGRSVSVPPEEKHKLAVVGLWSVRAQAQVLRMELQKKKD